MTADSHIRVETLHLGEVVLPATHPRASEGSCVVQAFLVHHPDGPIVVDTGVGADNDIINELYHPSVVPLVEALNSTGVDERDIVAIINTHLHFDHCGQNASLPNASVYVQQAEVEAVAEPLFTVPEWAHTATERLRVVDGDAVIADDLRLIATPGHTPGHQSVLIGSSPANQTLVVGQCCYDCAEFQAGVPAASDSHDPMWVSESQASLRRLTSLTPTTALFSHDTATWSPKSGPAGP